MGFVTHITPPLTIFEDIIHALKLIIAAADYATKKLIVNGLSL